MRIDLHAHSTRSDGTRTPAELVADARRAHLDAVAITDHDTTSGWLEATAAAHEHRITLVSGVEISCERDGRSVHLLGYLVDPSNTPLATELAKARESRVTRLERMVARLAADGIPVTYAAVLAKVPPGATPGRPHIADALVAAGAVATRDEAFARWLHDQSPYYVHHYAPDPVRAVGLVQAAGGVAVLAHPFTQTRGAGVLTDRAIGELADAGLRGLEADHPDHDAPARARAHALAARLGLLVTGSSDYHGAGKTTRLGDNLTDPAVLEAIEAQATGAAIVRPERR
ncbi:MAG: PHP domain-containing protein [Actinomycetales bacterium]|nr:PHP domain-containing protein [Candidatus Phosphoribacter baldrii]